MKTPVSQDDDEEEKTKHRDFAMSRHCCCCIPLEKTCNGKLQLYKCFFLLHVTVTTIFFFCFFFFWLKLSFFLSMRHWSTDLHFNVGAVRGLPSFAYRLLLCVLVCVCVGLFVGLFRVYSYFFSKLIINFSTLPSKRMMTKWKRSWWMPKGR